MANRDNSGALFKEDDKKSEKHPDYKGNCLVNGKQMYIAGWINESQNGKKYMSLQFSEPTQDAKYKKESSTATPKPQYESMEDDLPF